jgi:hypothetical protein
MVWARRRAAAAAEAAMREAIHPSNLVEIDGAVPDGPCEGPMDRATAAGRLRRRAYRPRAGSAIRRARGGEEGAAFRALDGTVRHRRRAD